MHQEMRETSRKKYSWNDSGIYLFANEPALKYSSLHLSSEKNLRLPFGRERCRTFHSEEKYHWFIHLHREFVDKNELRDSRITVMQIFFLKPSCFLLVGYLALADNKASIIH